VRVGPATVFLSDDDYEIDWASFAFVAVDDVYAGDYRGAYVVDVGAHKGYYGAYALRHGARGVVSYEPESTNASYLEAASARLRDRSTWEVRRAAVGATAGEAPLHVMGASWGHAIHPPDAWAGYEVGVEEVRVEALADVLSQAAERARGARTIVKVNIEGEECPTILGTPASAWRDVAEAYVETHPWAACGADELAHHLAAAGLVRAPTAHPAVLRLARR
jgi:FkbM family methyltransferase